MQHPETVTVNGPNGPLIMNKSDYDANPSAFERIDNEGATVTTNPNAVDGKAGEGAPAGNPNAPDPGTTVTLAIGPAVIADDAVNTANATDGKGGMANAGAPVGAGNAGATAPNVAKPQMLVKKQGTGKQARFIVVNEKGEPIVADGLDADGYKSESEAWNAILKVNQQ